MIARAKVSAVRLPARTGIGIAIGQDAVRGVAVRRGVVLWAAETPVGERPLAAALAELLERMPTRGWPQPAVSAVVGPAQSQVRRITRLPALTNTDDLNQVVRAGVTRFFPHRGVPLVATGVDPIEAGVAWGGAVDQPVVTAIIAACRAQGIRLRAVAPTIALLPHAIGDGRASWQDGDVCAELTVDGGRLQHVRSAAAALSAGDDEASAWATVAEPLAGLGERAYAFADAYAAAVAPSGEPLAVDLRREPGAQRTVPGWRLAVAALLAAASVTGALLFPGLRARHEANLASAELQALTAVHARAVERERELGRVTGALEAVAAFDAGRRPALLLLGEVARALPGDAMLVATRLDSAGGTMVALTPRTAQLLARLERVPRVTAPEVVGPVTREWINGAVRERVTVRFRWVTP